MSIYTIGDLHLSFNEDKPMSVFGEIWNDYEDKIKEDWNQKVKEDDLVVLPGDFSWSMYLKDTYKDFEYLNKLPGKKLLLKGNHDYWWTTVTSMRNYIKENNEAKKMINRESARLELSIQDALKEKEDDDEIIAFMHYPPILKSNVQKNEMNEFIKVLKKYDIKKCYYGHLHSSSIKDAIEGVYFGIEFKLVSADGLNFKLEKVC